MKTNESGRSMVEMLGVLAIIGVLSIGGIAGYTTAMNRYRANEVIDMATKYATIVFTGAETYRARHNGTLSVDSGDFEIPELKDTALNGNSNDVNGATISKAEVSTTDSSVQIKINFNGNDKVCMAAASALGYGSARNETNKDADAESMTYAAGTEDCGKTNVINFTVRQS